ncbi:hypothetical protein HDU96_009971 [Phlyctochytrium bullatum]|nr:hypothetical protein HDU96_009971 [Phlyctochytrium bullatum]
MDPQHQPQQMLPPPPMSQRAPSGANPNPALPPPGAYQDPRFQQYVNPQIQQVQQGWVDSASEASNVGFEYNPNAPQQQQQPYQQRPPFTQQPPPPGAYAVPPVPPHILAQQQQQVPAVVPAPAAASVPPPPPAAANATDEKDAHPNVPSMSYALVDDPAGKPQVRTNLGNTRAVMLLLSEMWIVNLMFLLGGTFLMTFYLGKLQDYTDTDLWNIGCYWKIGWLLPLPYTIICFFGLVIPYRTNKFLNFEKEGVKKRRVDNLYILTVTKGNNREAVYRAWEAHKHLERLHSCIRVHVLTDEPYFFENINCYTCPKAFVSGNSKYKARALEWYRQTMRFTEYDWVLHLDEESVIDDESVRQILEFIWYQTDYHFGQGVILYNQYRYWANWIFTVADAIRVGDDLSRFHLQFTYFHRPVFGAHGSFLLNNGLVENAVSWDLGSLTEDYQFAMKAWDRGFRCGGIPGLVREQSPMDFIGFLKQRRRWYVGIRRLPEFLPKLWAFFWSLGILSLYCTIASIVLGFVPSLRYPTPRWFGLAKDFSFVTFVYLYVLGIFVQDIDKGANPLLVLVRLLATVPIQFIAVVMEGLAVMYGILFPPADFDVIKK